PSQLEAGPWQFSQLTPSLLSKVRARWATGTSSEWQARHLCSVSGCARPRIFPIRCPIGLVSTSYALVCLSFITQVLYSFCRTEVSLRGCTPPWQLGELQEPGPLNIGVRFFPG